MKSSENAEQGDKRVTLLLRFAPALKTRLAAYARARGLTLNAAVTVLVDRGLSEAEQQDR